MSRKLLLLTVVFCLLWPASETAAAKSRPKRRKGIIWKTNGKKVAGLPAPWYVSPPGKNPSPFPSIPRAKPHRLKEYEPPVKPLGGEDEYRAGVAAMERLDYRMAIKLFKVVIAHYRGRYVGRAKSRLREIGRLAREKMALYEQLWGQGRQEEAIRVLAEVAEKFEGSGTATTAKRKLLEFAQTPGLAETVRKARAEGAAGFRGRMMRRLSAAGSDVPGQEAVATEQDTLEVRGPSAQDKCNRLLSLAANYRLNRQLEAARAAYKEIIDQYPGTDFAEEARGELEALEKEMEEAGK